MSTGEMWVLGVVAIVAIVALTLVVLNPERTSIGVVKSLHGDWKAILHMQKN